MGLLQRLRFQDASDKTLGRLILCLCFLWLASLTLKGNFAMSGDSPHYVMIARSLAMDLDLDMTTDYQRQNTETPALLGSLAPESHIRTGSKGRLYPYHPIGTGLVVLPAYLPARWIARSAPLSWLRAFRNTEASFFTDLMGAYMAALSAFLALVLFRLARAMAFEKPAAFWATVIVVCGVPFMPFGILVFNEVPAAILIVICCRSLVDGPRVGLAFFLALSALPWLHPKYGVLSLLFAGLWLVRLGMHSPRLERPAQILPAIAPLVSLGSLMALSHRLWGSPLRIHYDVGGETAMALKHIPRGVTGLLIGQEAGLLLYAPLYAGVVAGACLLWKRSRWSAALIAAPWLAHLLLSGMFRLWSAGWSPPCRYLVPVLPLLALPLAALLERGRTVRNAMLYIGILLLPQVIFTLFAWSYPVTLWGAGGPGAPFFRSLAAAVGLGDPARFLPALTVPHPDSAAVFLWATAFATLAGWLCWVFCGKRAFFSTGTGPERER